MRHLVRPSSRYAHALALAGILAATSPAAAERAFIEWISETEGAGGGITATVDATLVSGILRDSQGTASEPTFVDEFATTYPRLNFSTESSPADMETTISFDPALPEGSLLIIVDVDYRDETVVLFSGGAPLTLVEQRETIDGETSTFPTWDPTAGTLVDATSSPSDSNEWEASIFDVGGRSAVDVDFYGGNHGSGIQLVIALPGAVPTDEMTWSGVKAAFATSGHEE